MIKVIRPRRKVCGFDVSHHQSPRSLDWGRVFDNGYFVIIRATHGVEVDRHVHLHVRGARTAVPGFGIGLYHLFRPECQPDDQVALFNRVAGEVGFGEGDIAPAVDVERVPIVGTDPLEFVEPMPSWTAGVRAVVEGLLEVWGECMLYLNRGCWFRLGEPEWMKARPLWLSHWYVQEPLPPTGWDVSIWQTGKGVVPGASMRIDQDTAFLPLPRVQGKHPLTQVERERVSGLIGLTVKNSSHD